MKRTGRLQRHTPLRAGGKLRRRSQKTADLYRTVRVPLVKQLLEERPVCQHCSAARSTDVHEPKLRSRGGDPFDPAQCVALCRGCHRWVHDNPAAATAEGWMRHSWNADDQAGQVA